MYQFFVEEDQIAEKQIVIVGSDHNHIRNVLRMKSGERVRISTREGRSFFCHIHRIEDQQIVVEIDEEDVQGTELSCEITLFQGLPKGDKMELIIQKATELGVRRVVPVAMNNCVVKLDEKKAQNKQRRWQAIAESAAKQSKRTIIPQIDLPITYQQAMEQMQTLDHALVPYENERGMAVTREILHNIPQNSRIGVLVGPEGGFSEREISCLGQKMHRISLGRRILRTETAGLATLAMLVYELDD